MKFLSLLAGFMLVFSSVSSQNSVELQNLSLCDVGIRLHAQETGFCAYAFESTHTVQAGATITVPLPIGLEWTYAEAVSLPYISGNCNTAAKIGPDLNANPNCLNCAGIGAPNSGSIPANNCPGGCSVDITVEWTITNCNAPLTTGLIQFY